MAQCQIKFAWRIAQPTIWKIINETINVIHEQLLPEYMKFPESVEEWEDIATAFYNKWNVPHCLGSIDGIYSFLLKKKFSLCGALYHNFLLPPWGTFRS